MSPRFEDLEAAAREALEPEAYAYVALALGAEMVLLGRPYVYGLAIDGADGVREVCRNFLADLDLAIGLLGRASVDDLERSMLVESSDPILGNRR